MHKRAAVKSSLGAQTVLGDRHDPVCEIYSQAPSVACGTRPRELSNGSRRKQIRAKHTAAKTNIVSRVRRRDHVLREFANRAGVRVGEAQHV